MLEVGEEQIESGLKTLEVWRKRGSVPKAVLITHDLLSILHSDGASKNDFDSDLVRRHALSSALIRCVNMFCDAEQQGRFAVAISGIAARIGLPVMLVDLRHAGTHGQSLPALDVLEEAARVALDWLKKTYWLPMSKWREDLQTAIEHSQLDPKELIRSIPFTSFSQEVRSVCLETLCAPRMQARSEFVLDALDEMVRICGCQEVLDCIKEEHVLYVEYLRRKFGVTRKANPIESAIERSRRLLSREVGVVESWTLAPNWSSCPLGHTKIDQSSFKGNTLP